MSNLHWCYTICNDATCTFLHKCYAWTALLLDNQNREIFSCIFLSLELHLPICMGYWPSVKSRWLDIGQVFFCVFMDRDEHKLAKNEQGQYPTILTEQTWSIKDLFYPIILSVGIPWDCTIQSQKSMYVLSRFERKPVLNSSLQNIRKNRIFSFIDA